MDVHIKSLLQEIEELKTQTLEQQKDLIKKQEELRKLMPFKMLLGSLDIGSQMLGFFGNTGNMVGGMLSSGLGVGQSFLSSETEEAVMELPKGVKSMLDEVQQHIAEKGEKEKANSFQKKTIDAKLIQMERSILQDHNSLEAKETWTALKVKFETVQDHGVGLEIVNELEQGLQQSSKNKEKLSKALEKAHIAVNVAQAGAELYNTYKSDQSKLNELGEAIEKTRQKLEDLQKYERKVLKDFNEYIDKVKTVVENFQDLKGKSHVGLDVKKWDVKKYLREVQYETQEITKGFTVESEFKRTLEKIEGALETVITLYERIQNFQDQATLARYIADISSPYISNIKMENPILKSALSRLEKSINDNVILEQYFKVINAVKQWVFPFAPLFIGELEDLQAFKNTSSTEDAVDQVIQNFETLDKKLGEYRTSIRPIDRAIKESEFRGQYISSVPFFTWSYNDYPTEIENILKGKEVILKVDNKNYYSALKFDQIGLELSHKNLSQQSQLLEMLKNYDVELTHWGNSYYMYGQNIYQISSGKFCIEYSFETKNDIPIRKNKIYTTIRRGHPMLSPYAYWSVRIKNPPQNRFQVHDLYNKFKNSIDQIDFHLVGHGYYVDETMMTEDLKIDKYYVRESNKLKSVM